MVSIVTTHPVYTNLNVSGSINTTNVEFQCRGVGRSSKVAGGGGKLDQGAHDLTFPKYDLLPKRLFLFLVQGEKWGGGDDTLPLPQFGKWGDGPCAPPSLRPCNVK